MASRPNASALTALAQDVVAPAFLCWMDIVGDPVRATTYPYDLTPSGTGDANLDGYTFSAVDPTLVEVSEAQMREGGTETITASLSGLIGPDATLLNIIGDRSNWLGREARFWQGVRIAGGTLVYWNLMTGRMSDLHIAFGPESQTIIVSIESYLVAISSPSNRTYLDQSTFDSGDLSAAATIACANGINGSNSAISGGAYGGGGPNNNSNRFEQEK